MTRYILSTCDHDKNKERERMRKFSGAEIEVFLVEGGVEKNILFSSVSSGVTDTGKSQTRKEVTDAVNCV